MKVADSGLFTLLQANGKQCRILPTPVTLSTHCLYYFICGVVCECQREPEEAQMKCVVHQNKNTTNLRPPVCCDSSSILWITYSCTGGAVLQDLMLRHGWRTGAIVPELEVETRVVNTEQYAQSLTWLQALTGLLERLQVSSG